MYLIRSKLSINLAARERYMYIATFANIVSSYCQPVELKNRETFVSVFYVCFFVVWISFITLEN